MGNVTKHNASDNDDFIHLVLVDGTTKFFDSRTPTNHELENGPHFILSSPNERNLHNVQFPMPRHPLEDAQRNVRRIRSPGRPESESKPDIPRFDMSTHNFDSQAISCAIPDRLAAEVRIQNKDLPPDVPMPMTFAKSKRHTRIFAQELSKRWLIGLAQAHETIKVTTQNRTRSAVLSLNRQY